MNARSVALICLLLASSGISAQGRDPDETKRLEAAARLALYEIPRYFTDDMVVQMSRTLPPDNRAAAVAFLKSDEMKTQLVRTATPIIAKHFTLDEIEAMYRMSSSEIGQAVQRKQAAYYSDILSSLERDLGPILDRFMRQRPQPK